MPFGLTNAPATFQRFMNYVFQPYFGKSIRVFIDDFCIYSSKALHLEKVDEGFIRLAQMGGQLNHEKCHIGESSVTLLGHVVSERGIEADPNKVKALLAVPSPSSVKQLTSFIQKVRYMGRFIHLLSQLVFPLQQLTHSEELLWSNESERCFQEVKKALSTLPIILQPCWDQEFFVNPSFGEDALGAALIQKDAKTGLMRPVYFSSRVMTTSEKGYKPVEVMVLSLMFAVRKFRSYLLPRPFTVITTEEHFPYVLQHMDVSARIAKWVIQLQEFDYTFKVEDSTRACLADLLTHKIHQKKEKEKGKVKEKASSLEDSPRVENAHALYFDGAYKRIKDKAAAGIVVFSPEGDKLYGEGISLEDVHSNNEAEYQALLLGLRWCLSHGITRVNVFGDSMLIVKQMKGIWACKNDSLAMKMREAKTLMRKLQEAQIYFVPRGTNVEADALAAEKLKEVMLGIVTVKLPLFQGMFQLQDVLYFLEHGEAPTHMNKSERRWLATKATKYRLINDVLYCKGKDAVLRKVPTTKEIMDVIKSCHEGVCGGHFAQEITSRKILQAGFVWPSLHRDVQHWCRTCDACQKAGPRKLVHEKHNPITAYGPFEKWGIDAIGPLPRTQSGREYIIMGVDYMTRWVEASATSRITAQEVGKFVFESICCRFGTPLEIISDRGPGFRADLVGELMERLKIKRRHSTPYYPQCNGLVEKVNGMICKIITKQVHMHPKHWDRKLNAALWAYRTSFRTSLGYTPFHLVYGQEALLPIEVELASLRVLATSQEKNQDKKLEERILDLERLELDREAAVQHYSMQAEKRRKEFNKKLASKNIREGSLVLRYDNRFDNRKDAKLVLKWEGPFVVIKKYPNGSYKLGDMDGRVHKTRVNGWRLKLYHSRVTSQHQRGDELEGQGPSTQENEEVS